MAKTATATQEDRIIPTWELPKEELQALKERRRKAADPFLMGKIPGGSGAKESTT